MCICSGDLASPDAERPRPQSRRQDLFLSAALIFSGPALGGFGAAILAGEPDLRMLLGRLWSNPEIQTAETVLGLLAAAFGLLISIGAAVAVLATLTHQIAHQVGAWRVARLSARLSPGFIRRTAALTLGAGLALTAVAADSWPKVTATESAPALQDEVEDGDDVTGEPPTSALFDTTDPEDAPGPGSAPPREPRPTPETDPDPVPNSEDTEGGDSSGAGEPCSGSSMSETPSSDRLQGLPQRRLAEPEQVVVRLGDSLWDIAADHLGADATDWEIAASWPRWYEANRERIGADPGIILPGTTLHVPSPQDTRH